MLNRRRHADRTAQYDYYDYYARPSQRQLPPTDPSAAMHRLTLRVADAGRLRDGADRRGGRGGGVPAPGRLRRGSPRSRATGCSKTLLVAGVAQVCLYYADLYDLRLVSDRRELFIRIVQALGAASFILAVALLLVPGPRSSAAACS